MSEEERQLVAAGILTMPTRPLDLERVRNMPKSVTGNAAIRAIIEDRNEGY